jgi:hypothetical protein
MHSSYRSTQRTGGLESAVATNRSYVMWHRKKENGEWVFLDQVATSSHLVKRENMSFSLTSFVCPWKDLMGFGSPSLHTWIHLSVLHDAKLSSVCQSTSSAGAEWNANCCLWRPV